MEELRLEGLIQDFYNSDQMSSRSGSDRKLGKMETITEEHDGSKLSVREILKRFEDLRTRSDSQNDEKSGDKTLMTIQETLDNFEEKVKNYQVETFVSDSHTLIERYIWPSISLFCFAKKKLGDTLRILFFKQDIITILEI